VYNLVHEIGQHLYLHNLSVLELVMGTSNTPECGLVKTGANRPASYPHPTRRFKQKKGLYLFEAGISSQ
jgi:hypothetical protein